jgi:hypothetical protein
MRNMLYYNVKLSCDQRPSPIYFVYIHHSGMSLPRTSRKTNQMISKHVKLNQQL